MKTSKTPSLSWQNKLISTALASVSLILGAPQLAMATLPVISSSNLVVQAGSATASTSNTNSTGAAESLTVQTTTANTVLTWNNFSDNTTQGGLLTTNDTIYFNVPSNGAVLNNITGGFATILGGSIKSNGNVFFLNPAGVIVGGNTNINVNGLYISTIPDTTAISYFYQNGTLGVFNNVPQVSTLDSGIIYIQSGANINTASGNGQVSLASMYSGPSVTITSAAGATTNGNFNTTTAGQYSAGFTIGNNPSAATVAATGGITVDSILANGNLTIISQGAASPVVIGSTTLQSGYPASGGLLTGGVESITTNNGNVSLGNITNGGNLTISTLGTATGSQGSITGTGAINILGSASLSTNGGAITINANNGTIITAGSLTATSGSSGASVGNVSLNGSFGGTTSSLYGNAVNYTNTATGSTTLSSVTSYGLFTANTVGNLTVTNLNSGSGANIVSSAGLVNVGNTTTVSTINGTTAPAGSTTLYVSGTNGVTLTNANVNVNGTVAGLVSVTSSNSAAAANITLNNITVNGATYVSNANPGGILATTTGMGSVTLSTINVLTNRSTISGITVNTANGAQTLTNVTINNGSINTASVAVPLYTGSISLTNIVNNSPGSSNVTDSYTTGNGGITLAGVYNTTNAGVNINVGAVSGAASETLSTLSGSTQNLGGPLSLSTKNGSITVTGLWMNNPVQNSTTNAVKVSAAYGSVVTAVGSNVTLLTTNGDLNITSLATQNSGQANETVSITATGNLSVSGTVNAPNITLVAANGGVYGNLNLANPVAPYANATTPNGSVYLQSAGDISTTATLGSLPANKLTLISTSGNVNVDSVVNTYNSSNPVSGGTVVKLTATTGNINVSTTGNLTVGSGSIFTAGKNIFESNGGVIDTTNAGNNYNATVTLNAGNSISLPGANVFPNLVVIGATNNATISVGLANVGSPTVSSASTTNIASGTNVAGNLTINAAGPISIGVNPSDSITVAGYTVLSTLNTSASTASISTAATSPNLVQGLAAQSYYGNVSIGVAGGTPNIGQVTVSALGNANYPAVTSINTAAPLNLGTISSYTLNINAPSVSNTSGIVYTSNNANINANGGSVVLGSATASANIASLNLISASSVSLNENSSSINTTVYGQGNNMSAVTLVGPASGSLTYTSTGTVGTISESSVGNVSYYSAGTSAGSISTLTGSITATSTGLGAVSFNIGTTSPSSSIVNNGSFTLNNIISSGTAGVTVTANSGPVAANVLTLGSGINLLGTGAVTFSSGNTQLGSVVDTQTSTVTTNSKTTFTGSTISVTNVANTLGGTGGVSFTDNGAGNITYTNNSSVLIAGMTLGSGHAGTDTITSVTGNITQTTALISISNAKENITYQASSTGNNGVVLGNANTVYAGSVTNIIASGNSVYNTNNGITLGTVTIMPAVGATPNASDLQLSVTSTGNSTLVPANGSISQTSAGIKVWGAATFSANSASGVNLSSAGNNFGAITILSSGSVTGNATITEAATSTYNSVVANNFTAVSSYGDILTATGNSAITVNGNSSLQANNISLTNTGDQLNGVGGNVFIKAAQNATLVDIASYAQIANGSTVGGNLSFTDPTANATIADQAGTSGITVTGIASLLATGSSGTPAVGNGQINFAGTNNKFGGLVTKSGGMNSVTVSGNLVLVPGSADTNGYYTALNGNITTSGAGAVGTYNYLTLVTTLGSVTISNDLKVTAGLTINAPLGTVNLSGMSISVDLTPASGSVVVPSVTAATYIAPNP